MVRKQPQTAGFDEQLSHYATTAIRSAAADLGVDSLALAKNLQSSEIARLVKLLNAALPHVENRGLRHRIEDVLLGISDGRLPSTDVETELDWALSVSAKRRKEGGSTGEQG